MYLVQVSLLLVGQQGFQGPVLNLGLKLTVNVITSQIHLVRQSL
jgi:hypothetical protein